MKQDQAISNVTREVLTVDPTGVNKSMITVHAKVLPGPEGTVDSPVELKVSCTFEGELASLPGAIVGITAHDLDVVCGAMQPLIKLHAEAFMTAVKTEMDAFAPDVSVTPIAPVWDAAFASIEYIFGEKQTIDVSPYVFGEVNKYEIVPPVPGLAIDNSGSITGTPDSLGTKAIAIRATRTVKPLIPATPGNPEVPMVPGVVVDQPVAILVAADLNVVDNTGPAFLSGIPSMNLEVGTAIAPVDATVYFDPADMWEMTDTVNGLVIDESSGIISGTPTDAGTEILEVTAINDDGETVSNPVVVIVAGASPIFSGTIPDMNLAVGVLMADFTASTYFTDGDSYMMDPVPGLMIDSVTGIISGTPTTIATTAIAVTANNVEGSTPSNTFNVIVA